MRIEIPKASDRMNPLWNQPNRNEILLDEEVAMMSEKAFQELKEYSCTDPTGVYSGKMWKANKRDNNTWYLCWFGPLPESDFTYRHCRLIKIMDWKGLMGVER